MKIQYSIILFLCSALIINLDWNFQYPLKLKKRIVLAQYLQSSCDPSRNTIVYIDQGSVYITNRYNRQYRQLIQKDQRVCVTKNHFLEPIGNGIIVTFKCANGGTQRNSSPFSLLIVEAVCPRTPSEISFERDKSAPFALLPPTTNFTTIPSAQLDSYINNLVFNLRQSDRNTIAQIQNDLQRYGYYQGNIDGNFGFQTEDAIRRFLRDGGQIRYILTPPQNSTFPPSLPQNIPSYSSNFHLLIPILRSEFPQRTQEVAALIPDREIEISGLENEFGFFVKVGLIPSQNDAEYYRQLLQERLRISNISIYRDR